MAALADTDFERDCEAARRALLAHCYQMLGSVQDAEDAVQETLLRAWRARRQFDASLGSLRTWLHAIATNTCLTALAGRRRRPLPAGIGGPWADPQAPLADGRDIPWMQPFPDDLLAGDPAAALLAAGRLRLALVAAMQLLPPRQRAILILREALGLPAAEVAGVLGTSAAAVNSGLQRARASLAAAGVAEEQVGQPADGASRALLDQYVSAFRAADLDGLKRLLADSAILEMPPFRNWYAGQDDYARFMARVFALRGTDWQFLSVGAGGQPALAAYVRAPDSGYQLHTLQVFAVAGGRIRRTVAYADQAVFDLFGLAASITSPPAGFPQPGGALQRAREQR
ncbi:MAG TPA: RNA polymerase subunit sigma-70 [Streptosporangiaceae bacterium]|nr:RNA polymerase subunit sigma-70 [Streptosporangiaceae bacterium]